MLHPVPRQITSDADLWEAITVHGAHFQHCRDRIEHQRLQRLQLINKRNREAYRTYRTYGRTVRHITRRTSCS